MESNMLFITKILGNVAVCTTIIQFLSGVLVCRQFIANRTTGESTPLPFICCLLSCTLWLYYGVLKNDANIIKVNFVGVLLMIVYTFLFYVYTIKKSLVKKQCLSVAVILFIIVLFAIRVDSKDELLNFIGLMASAFTLAAIGAPLSKLFYVIKVKNTECLPFPLIVMSFLVSNLWMLYGYFIQDGFIKIVNAVGVLLSVTQLSLFLIYPSRMKSPLMPKNLNI